MQLKAIAAAVTGLMLASAQGAQAKAPKESYCSLIEETEDGKFRTQLKAGWSLYDAQKEDGDIVYASNVAGVVCLRSPLTLQPEDAETLKQGISLYFSDPKGGTTIVYKLKEGDVIYEVSMGGLSKSQTKKIKKSIAKVQALL